MKTLFAAPLVAFAALMLLAPAPAFAWGSTGHELVSGAAIDALPDEIPAFLRSKTARAQIALLGREPDRWRGAGKAHDYERDPGHYINLDDDAIAAGTFPLDSLPVSRSDFEAAIREKGIAPPAPGYLPYAIIDGWQQVVKDFGYWRASRVGAKTARTAADRAWFAADVKLRESLLIRDIGVWSHYVGDASQPQHVTEHHAGWDAYPDPMTYPPPGQPPEIRTLHNYFEGPFVKAHVTLAAVRAAMTAPNPCTCGIEQRTPVYIRVAFSLVRPLYELASAGGFRDATPAAVDFTTQRIAAGASEVRDEIIAAWRASATSTVGYPAINVADIESGKVILSRDSYGAD